MTGGEKDLDRDALAALAAAGVATDAERAALEARRGVDPELAADLDLWRGVAEIARAEHAAQGRVAPPGERAWARLQAAVAAESGGAGPARAAPPPPPRAGGRSGRKLSARLQSGAGFWRPLAIAASLLVAIQAGLLLSGDSGGEGWGPPSDALREAIGPQETEIPPERLALVAFNPAAEEGDLRRLLLDAEARLFDGPSALGLYTLAFRDRPARDAALQRFAVSSALVESADPAEAQP